MKALMDIKLAIKKFVGKNEVFIIPVLKFLLTFLALSRISSRIGFMSRLASKPIVLVVALAGSFLPVNLTLVILALIVVAHMYSLALECAIVVLAVFLILFLLYFRFASEDSVAAMLTPLAFVYHVPCAMPVAMGLKGTLSSMISVGSGAVVYHMLHFIAENAESLKPREGDMMGQFKAVIDALLGNKQTITYAVAFAATVMVVYLIRRLTIKYAWLVAIGAGEFTLLIVAGILNNRLQAGISMGAFFGGLVVSALINLILYYFCFDLNYSKVEKVQYEDDEFYYYVKAIPKNEYLARPNKKKARPANTASRVSSVREPVRSERTQAPVQKPKKTEPVRETKPSSTTRMTITRKPSRNYEGVTRVRPINSDEAAAAIRNRNSDKNE